MYYKLEIIVLSSALALANAMCCASRQQKNQSSTPEAATANEPASGVRLVQPGDKGYVHSKTSKIVTKDGRVLICRSETPTGSNLPRKVCRWADGMEGQISREQEDLRDIQRMSNVVTTTGK